MRLPRIKISPEEGPGIYHCYNRTPNGEFLFDEFAHEVYLEIRARVAEFCGIDPLAFALMHNHTHDVVGVPQSRSVSDEELLRRYAVLYPPGKLRHERRLAALKASLAKGGPQAERSRQRLLRMMGDVSMYQKLLKQLFTAWFNRHHNRFGTLWAERFGSTMVEEGAVLLAVMAYVDLNPVRAGIVQDPKDYHFCSYAQAVAVDGPARRAIMKAYGTEDWEWAHAQYRKLLFAVGSKPKEDAATIAQEHFEKVMKEGGKLSVATVLRCKVGHFTRGAVLGSRDFVARQIDNLRSRTGMKLLRGPIALRETEWGEWAVLRAVRHRPGELHLA